MSLQCNFEFNAKKTKRVLQKVGEDYIGDAELSVGLGQPPLGVFEVDLAHAKCGDMIAALAGRLQPLVSRQLGLFQTGHHHGQLFVGGVHLLLAFVPAGFIATASRVKKKKQKKKQCDGKRVNYTLRSRESISARR